MLSRFLWGEVLVKLLAKESGFTKFENKGGKEIRNLANIIMKFLVAFSKR